MKLLFTITVLILLFAVIGSAAPTSQETSEVLVDGSKFDQEVAVKAAVTARSKSTHISKDGKTVRSSNHGGCSTSLCGAGKEPCCDEYFCVGRSVSRIKSCERCSTSLCGAGQAPCCDGYFCVGRSSSRIKSCERCSTSFCGARNAPCCDGYSCSGSFCRRD